MDRSLKFQNTVDLARRALIADAVGGGSPGDYLNWDAAYAHKVIEDAISGIIQCNGAGAYSSLTLTDTSSIDFTYAGGALSAVVLPAGVNHNALANLAIGDVHTQYALLAGRAGGQVIKGDTASGGNLTLNSTAHATKGKIYLGVSSYYDEAAKVLAIGTTTPAAGIACAIIGGILGTDGTRAGDPTAESTTGLHWSFNAQSMASNIYGIGLGALRGSKYDMYFKTGSTNGGGYRWYIGDTEYMTMDKAGQVGIGTTSPATGVKLAVIGGMFGTDGSRAAAPSTSASAGMHWTFNATSVATNAYGIGLGEARSSKYDMWFQTGNVNGGGYRFYFGGTSELVTFSYQGKVGIGGVIAPSGLLHIATSTTAAGLIYFDQASADTDSFDLNFRKSRGTIASPTVVTTGDELGTISFWGYSGAGGFVQGAGFKFFSEGTIASTRIPGRVECWTATDATPSVPTKRWQTDSAGLTTFYYGIVAPNVTDSALTSGRVVIAGASGILSDDADLTFSGDTLTVTKLDAGLPVGSFGSSTTQTLTTANTEYAIALDLDLKKSQMTHSTVTNNSRVQIDVAGTYEIIFSACIEATAPNKHINIWLKVNGSNVADTNIFVELPISGETVLAAAFVNDFTAGQYFELWAESDNNGTTIKATAATGHMPRTPGIIVTVKKVSKT